jgi:hypothetical protein
MPFDFRVAHVDDVDFSFVVFGGTTHFGRATFAGNPASFEEATFCGPVSFAGTDFGSSAISFENP